MKSKVEIIDLIRRYLDGSASPEECVWVEQWYAHDLSELDTAFTEKELEAELKLLDQQIKQIYKPKRYKFWPIGIAAAMLMTLLLGAYYYYIQNSSKSPNVSELTVLDKEPGENKAILTLSGGRQIFLDSLSSNRPDRHNGLLYTKTKDGQLIIQIDAEHNIATGADYALDNEIKTPRGGQYQLILPDGSQVWLNTASSLRFPTHFAKDQRVVELRGEAYFEIAHKNGQPFIVDNTYQQIRVLGTHFNVSAYPDEAAIRTTLLEGKIEISTIKEKKLIYPGQEAKVNIREGASKIAVFPADINQSVAWKNGLFNFQDASIPVIMQTLSRWYNIQVKYGSYDQQKRFTGKIFRNIKLSETMEALKHAGIKTQLTGTADGLLLTVGE